MNKILIKYISLNILITLIVFFTFYFFSWNLFYKTYAFISFLIIDIASIFVFLGVYFSFKKIFKRIFTAYLFFTFFKNIFLLFYCFKYKQVTERLIFYLFIVYIITISIEIIYILKLFYFSESKKTIT